MNTLHILLVEDNASDAWILQQRLQDVGYGRYEIHHVTDVEKALLLLHKQDFDALLLDLSLPGISGLGALRQLQLAAPALPVVVLSGIDDEKLALQAMQHGTQDYLVKGRGNGLTLKRILHYAIERKRFEKNLIQLANFDALTGLANRRFFESRLEMALARVRRGNHLVGLLFLDLNGFKQVNDTYGHAAGDVVLAETARRLHTIFREYDTIARFGGDEFAVLLDGIAHNDDSCSAAEKITGLFNEPMAVEGNAIPISVSIGIATASQRDRLSAAALIQRADVAMYCAKEENGNTYRVYTGSMAASIKATA